MFSFCMFVKISLLELSAVVWVVPQLSTRDALPLSRTLTLLSIMSQGLLVFCNPPPLLFLPSPLLLLPHHPVTLWESVMVSKYLWPCCVKMPFLSLHIWWTAWLGLISPFYWSFGKLHGKTIYLIRIERQHKHEIIFLPLPELIVTLQGGTFSFEATLKYLCRQTAELVSLLGEAREVTTFAGPALICARFSEEEAKGSFLPLFFSANAVRQHHLVWQVIQLTGGNFICTT